MGRGRLKKAEKEGGRRSGKIPVLELHGGGGWYTVGKRGEDDLRVRRQHRSNGFRLSLKGREQDFLGRRGEKRRGVGGKLEVFPSSCKGRSRLRRAPWE